MTFVVGPDGPWLRRVCGVKLSSTRGGAFKANLV